jgi:hypothetical protein
MIARRRIFQISGALLVICLLVGCAVAPREKTTSEQYQDMRQVYNAARIRYASNAPKFAGETPDKVLRDYQILLYAYTQTAAFAVHAQEVRIQRALPPSIEPLPTPSGQPTVADVDRDYERVLKIDAELWRKSAMLFPMGDVLLEPPPLPPLQDSRDPRFARLVAMQGEVEKQKQVIVTRDKETSRKASEATARMGQPNPCQGPMGQNICVGPAPQQQRLCVASGQGWSALVPC